MKVGNGLDLQKTQLLNAVVQPLSGAPGTPTEGQIYYDTTLHQFGVRNNTAWVYLGGSTGTVTSVSVASANGFGGSVATATTTPAITITTSVTGLLKGNGTGVSAAVSGTDYAPATSGSSALKGNGAGGFANAVLNDVGAATADYSINSHKLTNVSDPTGPQDAATKNYVDGVAQGLAIKPSAKCKTTGAETFTIAAGSVTQINGTAVDGVSPAVGDRILVDSAPAASGVGSAGSAQPGNGLYIVTNNTTNLTVARDTSMSGANGPTGAFVFVEAGTASASAGYVVSTPTTNTGFTYGTNNVQWTQFSGAGEISVVGPISKAGNQLSLSTVPVASGGTGQTTAAAARGTGGIGAQTAPTGGGSGGVVSIAAQGLPTKVTAVIGDAATTAFVLTHNLNTRDVLVKVYSAATPWDEIIVDVAMTSVNSVTITFASAPAASQYNVVMIG